MLSNMNTHCGKNFRYINIISYDKLGFIFDTYFDDECLFTLICTFPFCELQLLKGGSLHHQTGKPFLWLKKILLNRTFMYSDKIPNIDLKL